MADEPEDIGHLITRLNTAAAKSTESSLAPFMLSPLEYGVLNRSYKEEASTVTELARVLPVDAVAMSRHVSKLVDKRLISRKCLVSDRRTVRLNLTWTDHDFTGTEVHKVEFPDQAMERTVAENSASGTPVGEVITATHSRGLSLTYALKTPSPFSVDASTGPITVAQGASLDHEARDTYTAVVEARNGPQVIDVQVPIVSVEVSVTIRVVSSKASGGAVWGVRDARNHL